jgi:hypothetical protein
MPGPHLHERLRANPAIRAALEQLLEARQAAESLKLDVWTFAVEMPSLLSTGCTTTHLRLLVAAEYIEHAEDVTMSSDNSRSFQPESAMKFGLQTCFVLTEAGVKYLAASSSTAEIASRTLLNGDSAANGVVEKRTLPVWDPEARELWAGDQLVKRFCRPAPVLELVLAGFQELAWPHHLDDPLPPEQGMVTAERLRDTVRRLNGCQEPHLIRFESDGLGAGIRWGWTELGVESSTDEPRMSHV